MKNHKNHLFFWFYFFLKTKSPWWKKNCTDFFSDLDYVSRVQENHLRHSTTRSERYIDIFAGHFSWFFINFGEKVEFSGGPVYPGQPPRRESGRPQTLKLLYLRDYLELGGQTVHMGVSAQPSPAVGNVSGALRGAWRPLREKYNFLSLHETR